MARIWGDLPLVDEPTLGYDALAVQRERKPKEEILTFIKKDLEDALALYPNNNLPAGRVIWSKPDANALKGQVYLWTGKKENGGASDFTTALNALNEVKNGDADLLSNYAGIFDYCNMGNKEILFAIKHADLETGDLLLVWNNNGGEDPEIKGKQTPLTVAIS